MSNPQEGTKGAVKTANAERRDPKRTISHEADSRQPESIAQFFRESPWMGVELDLERDQDLGREIAI
jgi:hypothetical protein